MNVKIYICILVLFVILFDCCKTETEHPEKISEYTMTKFSVQYLNMQKENEIYTE